jgi:hypothetical protein
MGKVLRGPAYARGGTQRRAYAREDVEDVPCPLCGATGFGWVLKPREREALQQVAARA